MLDNNDIKKVEEAIENKTEPRFKSIDKTLKSIKKDIKTIMQFIKFYDSDHQLTKRKVQRIETHLKLPPVDKF